MFFRIAPIWWPLLGLLSPIIVPALVRRNRNYREQRSRAEANNAERLTKAPKLDLPTVESLDLKVIVEHRHEHGFEGDAGVSYLLETEQGKLLFDIGFGSERKAFCHNAARFELDMDKIDALVISHLHCDHMGGVRAQRRRRLAFPKELLPSRPMTCYLPDTSESPGFRGETVRQPRILPAGIATTGPLARSLFFFGYTEEQALVIRLKGKGLVVITGCGHPTIEVILDMVQRLSDEPIHAICGGLHFPIRGSRGQKAGINFQTILGTGKPPWSPINDKDLEHAIGAINAAKPQIVMLSAHDTCDHSLMRMQQEINADVRVLKAGRTYSF